MQLGLHGLSFSVFNPEKNKFIGLEAYSFDDLKDEKRIPAKLDMILNHNKWFAFPYKKVLSIYQNRYTTLIPAPLFDEKQKNLYLRFNHPVAENNITAFEKVKNIDAVNLFYLPKPVAEKVKNFWPNAVLGHFSTFFIDCLALNFKNKLEKETLFVNVNEHDFNVAVFSGNKLVLHNIFKFNTKEDFIYFLLATIEQLGYNPEILEVVLMGKIEKGDKLFIMIEQYIGNYRFVERNDNLEYSYLLDEVKPHKYYVLLNALQCG